MPQAPDLVIATVDSPLHTEASLFKAGNDQVSVDDKLKVLDRREVEEQGIKITWLHVSLVKNPGVTGYFPEQQTKPAEPSDTGPAKLDLKPVSLDNFIRLILDASFAKGANPGVMLAIAHMESGKAWKKSAEGWKGALFDDFVDEEHGGGIGPFQFREETWSSLIQEYPGEFIPSDRALPVAQAVAAALIERTFFDTIERIYTTLELYTAFMFGIPAAKAIAEEDGTRSIRDVLAEAYGTNQTALDNQLKWRKPYLFKDDAPRTVADFRANLIPILNASLKVAEEMLVAAGVRGKTHTGFVTKPPEESDKPVQPERPTIEDEADPILKLSNEYVLCRRSTGDNRTPSGYLIEILQRALLSAGYYSEGDVSRKFDAKTEAALKRFQADRNLVADSVCRVREWELLTGLPAPNLFDRCLQFVAAFEGTGFTKAEGDFDGALLTWGLIGFTLAHDLPELLREIEDQYPNDIKKAFGEDRGSELLDIIQPTKTFSQRHAWVHARSNGTALKPVWVEGFRNLGSYEGVQKLQIKRARDKYWLAKNMTIDSALQWNAADDLDVALIYDTCVQNGGIKGKRFAGFLKDQHESPDSRGQERRKRWVEIIVMEAIKKWQNDVRARKNCYSLGRGKVHGDNYFVSDWGLTSTPISREQLLAYKNNTTITFMPADFGPIAEKTDPRSPGTSDLPWMMTALELKGTEEDTRRGQSNSVILGWVDAVTSILNTTKRAFGYHTDDTAWCGLFTAHCMAVNGIRPPDEPLWALNWANFGKEINEPSYGAIIVFSRPKGGHVGFYVNEDDTYYYVLGGNQKDEVNITKFKKKGGYLTFKAFRWPNEHIDKYKPGVRVSINDLNVGSSDKVV